MARMKRVIVPGFPHHVIQRGVRSMDIFFDREDRRDYLNLLRRLGDRFGVTFLCYCLMSNHVHLLAVPEREESLARAIGEAHRRYTRMINVRQGTTGYLFQGRFSSCPVATDEYFIAVVKYILYNPVKSKLVANAWDYDWSSASFHCRFKKDDPLVADHELLSSIDNWQELLGKDTELGPLLEKNNRTGRPFGPDEFYSEIERITGVNTRPGSPGRRPKKE